MSRFGSVRPNRGGESNSLGGRYRCGDVDQLAYVGV
jgi:hypothetical protein